MADIDVVKKRTSVWPWVLGLLALIVLVWLVLAMMGGAPAGDRGPAVELLQEAVHASAA